MKKSLLIVAAMFAAVCANAQQWKSVGETDAVDQVVAKGGEETPVGDFNGISVVLCGATDWTVKNAPTNEWTGADGSTYNNAYIQGNTNGMAASLAHSSGTSSHIKITAKAAGTLYVAAKYGKNKPIWAAKVATAEVEDVDVADMTAYLNTYEGQYIKDDATYGGDAAAEADQYAALPLAVEAGNTYFFWVSGSKIMLCGLNFVAGGADGIESVKTAAVKADAAAYNLAGQKVAADYKGLVIVDGKKMIRK